MLMARSGHTSVRSLAKYARVSAEALARHQAGRDPARRREAARRKRPGLRSPAQGRRGVLEGDHPSSGRHDAAMLLAAISASTGAGVACRATASRAYRAGRRPADIFPVSCLSGACSFVARVHGRQPRRR